jgi:hypothetical protein
MGPTYQDIARLAYQLWEERGRPDGSPEIDWERAEVALQIESTRLVQTPVERDEAMAESRLAEEDGGGAAPNGAVAAAATRKRRAAKTSAQKSTRTQ